MDVHSIQMMFWNYWKTNLCASLETVVCILHIIGG